MCLFNFPATISITAGRVVRVYKQNDSFKDVHTSVSTASAAVVVVRALSCMHARTHLPLGARETRTLNRGTCSADRVATSARDHFDSVAATGRATIKGTSALSGRAIFCVASPSTSWLFQLLSRFMVRTVCVRSGRDCARAPTLGMHSDSWFAFDGRFVGDI